MNIIRVTCFALGALVFAASCSKEAAEPGVYEWADGEIYFKTSLSNIVHSRAHDMTLDHLESFQVTCFNTGDIKENTAGFVSPYFENATFVRQENSLGVTFVSDPSEGSRDWPDAGGTFSFFAFSPSCDVMAADNPVISDANRHEYFNLINSSTTATTTLDLAYRLGPVRVNPDISRQFDFVTAKASGERWKDFNNGVELAFRHQMSQVELRAWGSSSAYNFEVAGVRLGNPVVESTFIFSDASAPASTGGWASAEAAVTDKVEYLYTCPAEGDINAVGDTIYYINDAHHNTLQSAASIMGRGGCAMVIPTVNPKWEGLADPNIGIRPYSTSRMYFSILMRVSMAKSGTQVYPYPDNPDNLTIIRYAVDRDGVIVARLYPGLDGTTFFTDSLLLHPYVAAEGEEIREYGWAAVPVDVDWAAGKRYVYTLDYTEGIGVHDPQDPDPGKPIKGAASISWGVSVSGWDYATENDDYHPDVNVPGEPSL